MKNQYFGDINDYRKYGLLRGLSDKGEISILVCWMLTENDSRTDGKFISYIDNEAKYGHYDPELFNILSNCIKSDRRTVDLCDEHGLISKAGYLNSITPDNANQREKYFNELYNKAKQYDLVFLDPDNGMEVKSRKKGNKYSSKYVYYDEVGNLYSQGNSLLIYQHFIREERNKFIQRISENLKNATGCQVIFPIKTSNVVYFLIPKNGLEEYFTKRVNLIGSTWGEEIRVFAKQ